jgi:excisionase family DNA binding protein
MRTIRETAQITGFPEYALRRLVKQNKIVYVNTGRKVLVNVDKFIEFLNMGDK